MSFFDSIINNFDEDSFVAEANFKAMLFGDTAGYFENVKAIKSFSQTEIVLRLKSGGIIITGENLYIKKYCEGDIAVCGKILKLERV